MNVELIADPTAPMVSEAPLNKPPMPEGMTDPVVVYTHEEGRFSWNVLMGPKLIITSADPTSRGHGQLARRIWTGGNRSPFRRCSLLDSKRITHR